MARRNNNKTFSFRGIFAKETTKKTILLLTIGLFSLVFSTASSAQIKGLNSTAERVGKYDFEDVGKRRSKNEVVPSVYYVLELTKNKRTSSASCSFYATGFQTNDEWQCSVKAAGDNISVYFEKDLIHTSDEEKEFIQFKKGQLLFNLVKSQAGDKTRYLFRPAAYKIYLFGVGKKAKRAVYFTQSK